MAIGGAVRRSGALGGHRMGLGARKDSRLSCGVLWPLSSVSP